MTTRRSIATGAVLIAVVALGLFWGRARLADGTADGAVPGLKTGRRAPLIAGAAAPMAADAPLCRNGEGQPALRAPRPSELSTTARPPLANRLGAGGTAPAEEPGIVLNVLNAYRRTFGAYPAGSGNRQITYALLGANARQLPFIPLDHPRLNARSELLDAWGTPFFFHTNSRTSIEVRSAGPDRQLFTADDLLAGSPPSRPLRTANPGSPAQKSP